VVMDLSDALASLKIKDSCDYVDDMDASAPPKPKKINLDRMSISESFSPFAVETKPLTTEPGNDSTPRSLSAPRPSPRRESNTNGQASPRHSSVPFAQSPAPPLPPRTTRTAPGTPLPNRNDTNQPPKLRSFFSNFELFRPVPEEGETVTLHVYVFPSDGNNYLSVIETLGFGAHHSGIEVYGVEYAFEGGYEEGCGIYKQKPKEIPSRAQWVFKESIVLGKTSKTKAEVRHILGTMAPKWPQNSYHLLSNNCNHFTDAFAKELLNGRGIPGWVNRLASTAYTLAALKGPVPTQEELMNMTVLQNPPTQPVDLVEVMDRERVQVFNENIWHPIEFILFEKRQGATLRSDCDPELLVIYEFKTPVQIRHLIFSGPSDGSSPKTVKLFNNINFNSFETAQGTEPACEFVLKSNNPPPVLLPLTVFQGVRTLSIHIIDNLGGVPTTQITRLDAWGYY